MKVAVRRVWGECAAVALPGSFPGGRAFDLRATFGGGKG